jgi:hypothetical protein
MFSRRGQLWRILQNRDAPSFPIEPLLPQENCKDWTCWDNRLGPLSCFRGWLDNLEPQVRDLRKKRAARMFCKFTFWRGAPGHNAERYD